MYVIKNAFKSIVRAKGRNILIFILVLFIAVSACIALSVRNSAEAAKQATYDSLSITAQISFNRQKVMGGENFDKSTMAETLSKSLSLDELEKYATSQYVDKFYYTNSAGLNVQDGFQIYETSNSSSAQNQSKGPGMGMGMSMGRNTGDISVTGYSSHDAMTTFISGENTISDGSVFDQDSTDNSCIISYELAVLNSLNLGDTVTLTNPSNEEQAYTFTVCGIFKNESSDAYANSIFTSYASLKNIIDDTVSNASVTTNSKGSETSTALHDSTNGTYSFASANDYEAFTEDVKTMGLDTEAYSVTSNDISQYKQSVVPLESLSKFTMIFFIVVLIIGGVILVVFNMFTVRERKYEIGVLAAIGMNKSKVALQFLTEAFLVTFVAIIIGTGIGAATSKPVGNYLLKEQIASAEETTKQASDNFGGKFQGKTGNNGGFKGNGFMSEGKGQPQNVEYQDTINTSTDFSVLASLMGVALLLTLVASSAGMISVLRYEPLKILSER